MFVILLSFSLSLPVVMLLIIVVGSYHLWSCSCHLLSGAMLESGVILESCCNLPLFRI